jgi:ATP/maltotriose-dependent transcriptional regulator MalT
MIALALNRTKQGFSERDRLLLNLLRPHLVQAYHSAAARTQLQQETALRGTTLEGLDRGVIVLTGTGHVLLMTERARGWLEQYCGKFPRHAARLPQNVWQWVTQQQTGSARNGQIPPPRAPLVIEHAGKRLVARLLGGLGDDHLLLLLEEQQTELYPAMLAPLGLSKRESEILCGVMHGKTNVQIGAMLGLSPLTVRLRLEHIFTKLGVRSRTAAAMCAVERLGILSW